MNSTDHIRLFLARFFLVLLSAIVVSGVLFIHKHTTRDGQIIIHIHPYDFTNTDSGDHHHQSEKEIYHLNIVFSGNYLVSMPVEAELPGVIPAYCDDLVYIETYHSPGCYALPFLRGPPTSDQFGV